MGRFFFFKADRERKNEQRNIQCAVRAKIVLQKKHREVENRAGRENLQGREKHRSRMVQTMQLQCLCVDHVREFIVLCVRSSPESSS